MADRMVHCTFCRQTYLAGQAEKCDLCRKVGGLVDPMSPEALPRPRDAGTDPVRRADPPPSLAESGAAALEIWRALKLGVTGVVLVGLGVWLLIAEAGPAGGGALIVGALLLLMTWASIRASGKGG